MPQAVDHTIRGPSRCGQCDRLRVFVYFSDQNPEVPALPCPQPQGTSFPGLRSYLPVAVCAYLILLLVSVPCPVGSNQRFTAGLTFGSDCAQPFSFCFRAVGEP